MGELWANILISNGMLAHFMLAPPFVPFATADSCPTELVKHTPPKKSPCQF